MRFQETTLGAVGKWGSGGTPLSSKPEYYDGDIPWLIIEDLNDGVIKSSQKTITKLGLKESSAKLVQSGTLLIAMYGSIGKLGIAGIPCATNQAIAFCDCNPMVVDTQYLFYYLLSVRDELNVGGRGGTQQNISQTFLKEFPICLPPLPEQKRIAAILAKADRLRRVRRYGLELADTYLQSVFLEMFGDPLLNQKQWDTVRLNSEVKHIESGWSPVCEDASSNGERWAVLKLSAVTTGTFLPTENKVLPLDLKPRPSLEVKRGDALITRKNTYELVAACAYVHETFPNLMLPDTIFRFRLKNESCLTPLYLWGLFSEPNFRSQVQSLASGSSGSMPNISKEKFMSLNIPLPPLPLQQKFSYIVQKFERLRAQGLEAQRQAEHLFQSLLHKAFEGKLSDPDGHTKDAQARASAVVG